MAPSQLSSSAPTPVPPRRSSDVAFTVRFLVWAAALVGAVWALDYFFQ